MRSILLVCGCAALAAGAAEPTSTSGTPSASATFIDIGGQRRGTATLTQTPAGVLIQIDLTGVPPGVHAFHVHEKGTCDPKAAFETAGAHYAPGDSRHGFIVPDGPHAGDMTNQFASKDGVLRAEVVNSGVTLGTGATTLFDADGSSLIVHASADDYRSQPSGNAGGRIACAVIRKN
jgi:superoxide dismutase, Cu-Zn family